MLSDVMRAPGERTRRTFARYVRLGLISAFLGLVNYSVHAQQATAPSTLPTINVEGGAAGGTPLPADAYKAPYQPPPADLGPLGKKSVAETPQSVTILPESLIENAEAQTVNDCLRYFPSVEVRDQHGI